MIGHSRTAVTMSQLSLILGLMLWLLPFAAQTCSGVVMRMLCILETPGGNLGLSDFDDPLYIAWSTMVGPVLAVITILLAHAARRMFRRRGDRATHVPTVIALTLGYLALVWIPGMYFLNTYGCRVIQPTAFPA